jgi:hypothetical protein
MKLNRKARKLLRKKLPKGKVKKKEYLDYLVSERNDEQLARDLGIRFSYKSIDEIRAEFESKYGSIYIEM